MRPFNYTVAGLLLAVAGLLFIFVNLHTMALDRRFEKEGKVAQAVVVKQYTSRPDRRATPDHFLRVSYRTDEGASHELDEQVTEEFWRMHPESSPVRVRYLASRPQTSEIMGGAAGKPNYALRTVIGLTAVAVGIVLLVLRVRAGKK